MQESCFTLPHTLKCRNPHILGVYAIVALDDSHLVGFVLMWWQGLKAALRNMMGTYRTGESLATIRKIAWMLALLIQCGDRKEAFWRVFMWEVEAALGGRYKWQWSTKCEDEIKFSVLRWEAAQHNMDRYCEFLNRNEKKATQRNNVGEIRSWQNIISDFINTFCALYKK